MNTFTFETDWYEHPLPQRVRLDEVEVEIVQVLRFFPDRRITCLAVLDDTLVILKCFATRQAFQKEMQAYQRLLTKGLNVPKLIDSREGHIDWIAFEYIQNTQSWESLNEGQQIRALERMVESLAHLHSVGLYHTDPHLDNFLLCENSVVLVDSAAIVPIEHQGTLGNLGCFLSQVYPSIKTSWTYFGAHYYRCRNYSFGRFKQFLLHLSIQYHHRKRKKRYLKKIFRSCSEFVRETGQNYEQMTRREFAWPKDLHPDALPVVRYFKEGNTATVWLAELDERWVVVKRYNTKGWLWGLKQWFKPSRAKTSWLNAHLLKFLQIQTPKPLLYRDEREGLFGRTSYFICDYIAGVPAHQFIESQGVSEPLLLSLKGLFDCMRWFYLCQTDLKASNIIIHNDNEPYIVDLDSIVHYSSKWLFDRRWKKAWQRWLANWQGNNRTVFEQCVD